MHDKKVKAKIANFEEIFNEKILVGVVKLSLVDDGVMRVDWMFEGKGIANELIDSSVLDEDYEDLEEAAVRHAKTLISYALRRIVKEIL